MKGNVLKLEMGYTMANWDGVLSIDDCFAYGSFAGCDEHCPVLIAGKCELQNDENAELYAKAKEIYKIK